jgi:hypothetical protein
LCGLVNGFLRLHVGRGDSVAAAAGAARDRLAHGGPTAFDVRDPDARASAVEATVQASLNLLDEEFPGGKERFAELAVFPENTFVSLPLLAAYWARTGGLDRTATRKLCDLLHRANLLDSYRLQPPEGVRLHAVLLDYLSHRRRAGLTDLHGAFMEAARGTVPVDGGRTAWWLLDPADTYLWTRHVAGLARHQRGATSMGPGDRRRSARVEGPPGQRGIDGGGAGRLLAGHRGQRHVRARRGAGVGSGHWRTTSRLLREEAASAGIRGGA